jgi:hypothetical protein
MWQSPLSWQRYVWFWPTSTLNPFKFTTLYLLSQVLDITIKWTIDIVHMHVLLILANHNSVTKCRILKKKQSKFILFYFVKDNWSPSQTTLTFSNLGPSEKAHDVQGWIISFEFFFLMYIPIVILFCLNDLKCVWRVWWDLTNP